MFFAKKKKKKEEEAFLVLPESSTDWSEIQNLISFCFSCVRQKKKKKMERESELVRLCIEAACESRESVEKWRKQRRTLDRLPSPLADALLRRLLNRRLLYPSLLEVFKHSVEEVDVRGHSQSHTCVDAEWIAYLGAFRHLRYLNLSDSHRITSSALWPLTG